MSYALKIPNVNFANVAVEQVTFIESVPCTGVTLSSNALTFEKAEESQTLTVTLTPANTTDTVFWESSNNSVATVSQMGVVTIHGIGSATISVTCGNYSASATITQTTIKASGTIHIMEDKYINPSSNSTYLRISSQTDQHSFGNAYTGADTVRIYGGSTNGIEAILVPYGATTVKVATVSGEAMSFNYVYHADATTLITDPDGNNVPSYIGRETRVSSETGTTVSYGQCVAFRFDESAYTQTPSYVYFE